MVIVRKLRLQRGWTQEQLAELTGLSTRSIQRLERGQQGGLETLNALAAVFEVDRSVLQSGEKPMNTAMAADEKEAIEYVKGIKEFYTHLCMYVSMAGLFTTVFGMAFGFDNPVVRLMMLAWVGWGLGVLFHGLSAYEVIGFFGPAWEKKLIEQRLGRKL